MTLILVFCAIAFFVFGYKLMDNLDLFLENNFLSINEPRLDDIDHESYNKSVILIYGSNDLVDLVKSYCNSKNYLYEVINELNEISKEQRYSCLLALSNKDVENLVIGSIGLKIYSIPHIITICNSQVNLKFFEEFNFSEVLLYTDETNKLFKILKGSIQSLAPRNN